MKEESMESIVEKGINKIREKFGSKPLEHVCRDQWGVGDQKDAKAFDIVPQGELIFGQFPHSRNDNNVYLRRPDGSIEDFDGFRRLIDIEIKSSNYMKESYYSGDEVRKSVIGKIFVDGVCLVEEFGRDPVHMMRRLESLIEKYQEHESQWFNAKERQKLIGRKIYYHDQPATIVRLIEDQGCIIVATEPDFKVPRNNHDDDDYDYWDDWKKDDHYEVKTEVLDPHIWWWRD